MSSSWAFLIGPKGPYSSERSPSWMPLSRRRSTQGLLFLGPCGMVRSIPY
ncbi:unnamed protein product, partial [Brassica rapa]